MGVHGRGGSPPDHAPVSTSRHAAPEPDVDLFEYQARDLFEENAVPVLAGAVATTPEEARSAAGKIGGKVVVKAQVKIGGRGKAGGVKLATNPEEALEKAKNILGLDIKGHIVKKILINELDAKAVMVGTNFTYGKDAAGKAEYLKNYGFQVEIHNLQESMGVISSTRIRNLIFEGDIQFANELLGHRFKLEGMVVHGEKRGRTIGYPTANLGLSGNWTIPADGIYAGWLEVENQKWPAAISIGTNPTFEGIRTRQIEAYALDQTGLDLYDKKCKFVFGWRLRETIKFDGLDPLLDQMKIDCAQARELTSQAR